MLFHHNPGTVKRAFWMLGQAKLAAAAEISVVAADTQQLLAYLIGTKPYARKLFARILVVVQVPPIIDRVF